MKILSITGCRSNIGKTTLACSLIGSLKPCAAIKIVGCRPGEKHYCPKGTPCGICESVSENWKLFDSPVFINKPETDTGRFHEAGADPVYLLVSDIDLLNEALEDLPDRVKRCDLAVIEGNSPARFGLADAVIMILSIGGSVKESVPDIWPFVTWFVINVTGESFITVEQCRTLYNTGMRPVFDWRVPDDRELLAKKIKEVL